MAVSNSHLVAAGTIAITAIAGAAIGWVAFGRRWALPGLEPIRWVLAEGFFVDRAYRLAAAGVLLPASRASGWVETRIVDGAIDLVSDSVAFAGQPRRWLGDLRLRQLLIGLFAGVVALAVITIVLAGRLIGKTG